MSSSARAYVQLQQSRWQIGTREIEVREMRYEWCQACEESEYVRRRTEDKL